MEYCEFLENKTVKHEPCGFKIKESDIHPMLFDWQKELVRLSLYRGRSALFEDCGLGKTFQQLEWAKHVTTKTGGPVLIFAPLSVSTQTKREGVKIGIDVNICKTGDDIKDGINITNYERIDRFDPSVFSGVVLDESSILKNFSGKIRNQIIDTFLYTQYKLCCTATPSPNDFTELGNTAEFLGIMTRPEMLSMFFINDTGDTTASWRLKGHAKENLFWEWVASWAITIQKPSDIGFEDNGFILPDLEIKEMVMPFNGEKHTLFVEPAITMQERRQVRKESIKYRVEKAAKLVNESDDLWLVWCNLNDESAALKSSIKHSVEVKGSDDPEFKEKAMIDFADGKIKCLISKPTIAGLGMNFQVCSKMAFVGLSDSFEQYYQAVRRCWRFGQNQKVTAYIITEEREGRVVDNIKRKERDMQIMFSEMVEHMRKITTSEIQHTSRRSTPYVPNTKMMLPNFITEGKWN